MSSESKLVFGEPLISLTTRHIFSGAHLLFKGEDWGSVLEFELDMMVVKEEGSTKGAAET